MTPGREGIVYALDHARQQGPHWASEVDLFGAIQGLLDGERPTLPEGHRYAQALLALLQSVDAAQDPQVVALNAWLNAKGGRILAHGVA